MVFFEISVIIITLLLYLILNQYDNKIPRKFIFTFIGILLFEYFTQALWLNNNLEQWAYLYLDVSWVITLGWTSIIIGSRAIIDSVFKRENEGKRFIFALILVTIIGILAEALVRYLGIREYAPAVEEILFGYNLFGLVPIEALYYIPVFMALVISFSKYWEISLQGGGK